MKIGKDKQEFFYPPGHVFCTENLLSPRRFSLIFTKLFFLFLMRPEVVWNCALSHQSTTPNHQDGGRSVVNCLCVRRSFLLFIRISPSYHSFYAFKTCLLCDFTSSRACLREYIRKLNYLNFFCLPWTSIRKRSFHSPVHTAAHQEKKAEIMQCRQRKKWKNEISSLKFHHRLCTVCAYLPIVMQLKFKKVFSGLWVS